MYILRLSYTYEFNVVVALPYIEFYNVCVCIKQVLHKDGVVQTPYGFPAHQVSYFHFSKTFNQYKALGWAVDIIQSPNSALSFTLKSIHLQNAVSLNR